MWQKHERFGKKLKQMPVLNLRNFSTFFLVYAVEVGALISKQPVCQNYMSNCNAKDRFQNYIIYNYIMAVSLYLAILWL